MTCRSVNLNSRDGKTPYAKHEWTPVVVEGHNRQQCVRCRKLNPLGIAPEIRFWDHVWKTLGCWFWRGHLLNSNYGQYSVGTNNWLAHRYAWIQLRGQIPVDMEIDHLCKNTMCVNPDHLEVVTHRENLRRAGWKSCVNPVAKEGRTDAT